jgi:putative phosphotransacetylase
MSAMMGCSPNCQECGACMARGNHAGNGTSRALLSSQDTMIDAIVAEVVRTISGHQVENNNAGTALSKIPLGVSNKHIHLREASFKLLFGPDAQPIIFRNLYQPGEFALEQTCIIVGPKMRPLHDVRILGPFRSYDQVEVSFTDAVLLGINPPVKESGDLSGAAPITIVGPKGSLVLDQGAIIANRHLHMTTKDASRFGVKQGDMVKVSIPGVKDTIFGNVLVRTNDAWKLQLHLDTDDANAAHAVCDQEAVFLGK